MGASDGPCDGQPDTRARTICPGPRRVCTKEALHDVGQDIGVHALTVVHHLDQHPTTRGGTPELHMAPGRGVVKGIAQKVVQRLGHACGVRVDDTVHRQVQAERDACLLEERPPLPGGGFQQIGAAGGHRRQVQAALFRGTHVADVGGEARQAR